MTESYLFTARQFFWAADRTSGFGDLTSSRNSSTQIGRYLTHADQVEMSLVERTLAVQVLCICFVPGGSSHAYHLGGVGKQISRA